jgi:ubiquitin-conjugating enzyme E2 D/E
MKKNPNPSVDEIIMEEYDIVKKSKFLRSIGCSAGPKVKNKMKEWTAVYKGPKGTPYEGFLFELNIIFPKDYPNSAPQVECLTPIYHMNISGKNICVSSIKTDWSKAKNISNVLVSIFYILCVPEPKDPYVPALAQLYKDNQKLYEKNARDFCEKHAIKIEEEECF